MTSCIWVETKGLRLLSCLLCFKSVVMTVVYLHFVLGTNRSNANDRKVDSLYSVASVLALHNIGCISTTWKYKRKQSSIDQVMVPLTASWYISAWPCHQPGLLGHTLCNWNGSKHWTLKGRQACTNTLYINWSFGTCSIFSATTHVASLSLMEQLSKSCHEAVLWKKLYSNFL